MLIYFQPPRIGGIKVYTHENIGLEEVVLDIDLMYEYIIIIYNYFRLYSDCRIKVNLGKVTAGIKEFEVGFIFYYVKQCLIYIVIIIKIYGLQ